MSRSSYRRECLEEAARLRKKADAHQKLVEKTPGSSMEKWDKQLIADLRSWARDAEREAGR